MSGLKTSFAVKRKRQQTEHEPGSLVHLVCLIRVAHNGDRIRSQILARTGLA